MPAQRLQINGPTETATLKLAASLTKKASDAAAKAYARAGLDSTAALEQSGYVEEVTYVLDKASGGIVELSYGHRNALLLGLQLLFNSLSDMTEEQETLLVDTEDTNERKKEVQVLALRIRRFDVPELELDAVWIRRAKDAAAGVASDATGPETVPTDSEGAEGDVVGAPDDTPPAPPKREPRKRLQHKKATARKSTTARRDA